ADLYALSLRDALPIFAHRVDLDLAPAQVLVDEHAPEARLERRAEVPVEVVGPVRDLHPTAAEDERRPHEDGVADLVGDRAGLGRSEEHTSELQSRGHL